MFGCVPHEHASTIDFSAGPACDDNACWCFKDDCNTKEWATEFMKTYVPPPKCFSGAAGANSGPSCDETQLFKDNQYERPECSVRGLSKRCIENNKGMGMGDGCSEHSDQNSCEAYRAGERKMD